MATHQVVHCERKVILTPLHDRIIINKNNLIANRFVVGKSTVKQVKTLLLRLRFIE
jgi:hypothetical protein